MRTSRELRMLVSTAHTLAQLTEEAEELLREVRAASGVEPVLENAARAMRSELLAVKHAAEDELVAWVLDCHRCGQRVHWVVGDGSAVGHWAHAFPPTDHGPLLRLA